MRTPCRDRDMAAWVPKARLVGSYVGSAAVATDGRHISPRGLTGACHGRFRKKCSESKSRSAGASAKADPLLDGHNGGPAMFPRKPEITEPEAIRFAYGDTALGIIAVAESGRGIAALLIGDGRERLRAELEDVLRHATLVLDQSGLAPTIAKAVALVDAPHLGTDLTLDLRGSVLEVAVWRALQAIPAGQTRTYGSIARSLPMAATAQDVGAACAANRVAVAVPCHRVVKSDGSISGYRWGVQRKRRLINMEGVA
jgi:AraC family transcriptional regulator of adaptative response/methylated-DNA-[protein]-cysteine methyltransferase